MNIMETKKKAPIGLIIFSALSFIPLIGIVFGIISVIIGLTNFRRLKLIFILGISGIGLSILIFGYQFFIFHNMEKSGEVDRMRIQTTEMFLNNLSNELVSYKLKNGVYPENLKSLERMNHSIVITDMFSKNIKGKFDEQNASKTNKKSSNYFYKLEKDSFVLFSVGKDGKPFTKDDIFPHNKSIEKFGKE